MQGLSVHDCRELFVRVGLGDELACRDLIYAITHNAITPVVYEVLTQVISDFQQLLSGLQTKKLTPDLEQGKIALRFLEAVHSIYAKGFTHPVTLQLLKSITDKHEGATTLLNFYHSTQNFEKHLTLGLTPDAKRYMSDLLYSNSDYYRKNVTNYPFAACLLRRATLLNRDKSSADKEKDIARFKVIMSCDRNYNPRVIYHCLLGIHHNQPFEDWDKTLKPYFKSFTWEDGRLRQLLQVIIRDNLIEEQLKCDLLRRILNRYHKQLEKFKKQVKAHHYDTFLQALDVLSGIAPDSRMFDLIILYYEKIPLTVPAGAEAQMRLADMFYTETINCGGDVKKALAIAKPYHDDALDTYQKLMETSPNDNTLKHPYLRAVEIVMDRENAAKLAEPKPVETNKENFLAKFLGWVLGFFSQFLLSSNKNNRNVQEKRVSVEKKQSVTAEQVDQDPLLRSDVAKKISDVPVQLELPRNQKFIFSIPPKKMASTAEVGTSERIYNGLKVF